MFAVGRTYACDTLSLLDQMIQKRSRDGVEVAQIHDRLFHASSRRQEIPAINPVRTDLIADQLGLQNAALDEMLDPMDHCDQNATCLGLGQIAGLSQDQDANAGAARFGLCRPLDIPKTQSDNRREYHLAKVPPTVRECRISFRSLRQVRRKFRQPFRERTRLNAHNGPLARQIEGCRDAFVEPRRIRQVSAFDLPSINGCSATRTRPGGRAGFSSRISLPSACNVPSSSILFAIIGLLHNGRNPPLHNTWDRAL